MKQWLERADQRTNSLAHGIGSLLVDSFHNLALFAIGAPSCGRRSPRSSR